MKRRMAAELKSRAKRAKKVILSILSILSIRDKLSASKKKGKYVGGLLPLGYRGDSENMRMLVDSEEAKTVRLIYDEYLRTGSPKAVQRLLHDRGVRGREWVSRKGVRHGGAPLTLAVIRKILQSGSRGPVGSVWPAQRPPGE